MLPQLTRRGFFEAGAAGGATISIANLLSATAIAEESKLAAGSTVLFQGDSITDAGRDRNRREPNEARAFGFGYPLLIAARLLADHPDAKLRTFNRGISGNKVPDLARRWQADCIALEPTVLSILIGVNDIWHTLNGNYDGTVDSYETGLRQLLEETKRQLPQVKLVMCEPFVLRCGAVNENWFPEFDQRRAACRRVADEMSCVWVPFQAVFDAATTPHTPPDYWAADGVHPTMAGHALMAKTWMESVF